MLVVKVEMWPNGDPSKARVLSAATFALEGIQRAAEAGGGVVRSHAVKILKDADFIPGGGARFSDSQVYQAPTQRDVWKEGRITGHITGRQGPHARGTWDLIGGALKVILGHRLDSYQKRSWP